MNVCRVLCSLATAAALTGCAEIYGLGVAPYLLEPGSYKFELDDRAGVATVLKAVEGEPLVLELDIPAAEVVSALPFHGNPDGGWLVRITLTDFSLDYELRLIRRVVSDFSTPDFCTRAESLTRGRPVACRFFYRLEAS